MKIRRIVGAIVFFIGLVFLLAIASLLFVPKNNAPAEGMEEPSANGIMSERENSIDVLIIGDSGTYSSFSPLQLWEEKGYTSYVCGTGAQHLTYSTTLLHRAFQTQKPKIVIVETLAIYRKVSVGDAALEGIKRYFPVFRYHNRWKTFNLKNMFLETNYNWIEPYKGYYYSNKTVPSEKTEYMTPTDDAFGITRINRKCMQRIKDLCDRNGAELILLSVPSTVNWDYKSHNGIVLLANELGCEYIDLNLMNDAVQIDWSQDTRDGGDHLNHFGAIKVTRYLAEYLSEKGVLTDHRGDRDYVQWDECLDKLNAEINASTDKDSE